MLGRDIQRVITSHADAAKIGRKIADEVNTETVSSIRDACLAVASWHSWQLLAKLTLLGNMDFNILKVFQAAFDDGIPVESVYLKLLQTSYSFFFL